MHRSPPVLLVLLLLVGAVGLCAQAPVPILPEGFVEDRLAADAFLNPASLEMLPDGRAIIGNHTGGAVFCWDRGRIEQIGRMRFCSVGFENGLLALTLDPGFPARPYLYAYWTRQPPTGGAQDNRVSRITLRGDLTGRGDRRLVFGETLDLVTGLQAIGDVHNGGALHFGRDGLLYLSTGDNGFPPLAQDPTRSPGKILRFRVDHIPDGQTQTPPLAALTPPGPAFFSGGGYAPFCFAIGLRNPFRFEVVPETGALFIVDVGEQDFEEMDLALGGENFGWPYFEANLPRVTPVPPIVGSLTGPVADGSHIAPFFFEAAILLGGAYPRDARGRHAFPPEYAGSWFITDLGFPGDCFRGRFDANGVFEWAAPVAGQPTDFAWGQTLFATDARVGADGAIYYLAMVPGELRRIRPRTSTQMIRVSGNGQAGNGGHFAVQPLEVALLDPAGNPIVGQPVDFSVVRGGGRCVPERALTDATGRARCGYVLADEAPDDEPRIAAWHPDCAPCFFDLTWRGLRLDVGPSLDRRVTIEVIHSAPGAPVTLLADAAPPAPVALTAAGPLWTSLLAPGPDLTVIGDGMGLLGGQMTGWATGPDGRLLRSLKLPPALGPIVLQAFAYDPVRAAAEAVMVSNPLRFGRD